MKDMCKNCPRRNAGTSNECKGNAKEQENCIEYTRIDLSKQVKHGTTNS